jgi:hypothetical protein
MGSSIIAKTKINTIDTADEDNNNNEYSLKDFSAKNHLQSLPLLLTGFLIEKEHCGYLCITICRPNITSRAPSIFNPSSDVLPY